MPIYRLESGEPYAVEIRPGAAVTVKRITPEGPVEITFSDERSAPSIGNRWVSITLILPVDVARRLFTSPELSTVLPPP